jgi:hypothetical protein
MARSTSGLKCPICGTWVSTDVPRTTFGSSTEPAAQVVREKMLVHIRTYHPDYLAWSKPYEFVGIGLIVIGAAIGLTGFYLKNMLVLPFALVVPLAAGVPLLIIYRRKSAAFKHDWTLEHPLGLATVQPSPSLFKCEICGKEITVEKGIQFDRRDHYKSEHPDFWRYQQRTNGIIITVIVALTVVILVLILSRIGGALLPLAILGILIVILSLAVFFAWTATRRFRRAWQTQHPV